jgi:hypothetical protein
MSFGGRMSKKLLLSILIAIATMFIHGQSAQACRADLQIGLTGTDVPFPWGSEIPFPWHNFEGLWYVEDSGWRNYFSFEIISTNETGTRYFRVRHYDGAGNILGEGTGVAPAKQKVVRAPLTESFDDCPCCATQDPFRYWVILRAFEEKDKWTKKVSTRSYITLLPFNVSDWKKGDHYEIKKVVEKQ